MKRTQEDVISISENQRYSLSEIAEIFHKDPSTIRRWVYSKKTIMLDGMRFIPEKDRTGTCWIFRTKRNSKEFSGSMVDYLTIYDMAILFCCSSRTIRRWIMKYDPIKFDDRIYLPEKDVGGRCWRFVVKKKIAR